MSNDHFVAQTYLRHFGDRKKRHLMHAYSKSDGSDFPCFPKEVCHEWDGDANPLLTEPRTLGDYRKLFEPKWRLSVAKLLQDTLSPEDKFNLSGYFANLMVCTPAWIRVGVALHDQAAVAFLSTAKRLSEANDTQFEVPAEAIELLETKQLKLSHDRSTSRAW